MLDRVEGATKPQIIDVICKSGNFCAGKNFPVEVILIGNSGTFVVNPIGGCDQFRGCGCPDFLDNQRIFVITKNLVGFRWFRGVFEAVEQAVLDACLREISARTNVTNASSDNGFRHILERSGAYTHLSGCGGLDAGQNVTNRFSTAVEFANNGNGFSDRGFKGCSFNYF